MYIDTEAAPTHYRMDKHDAVTLNLKEGKTEFVMYGTHQQLARETKSAN